MCKLHNRRFQSQHLQIMCGVSPLNFWLSYLVMDGAYIMTLSGLAVGLVWLTQESDLYTRDQGARKLGNCDVGPCSLSIL